MTLKISSFQVSAMYQEYSAASLYTQILYLANIVDTTKLKTDSNLAQKLSSFANEGAAASYDSLSHLVCNKYLKHNGYSTVSLSKLFEGLFPYNNATPAQA